MTRDDIIRWARQAGIKLPDGAFPDQGSFTLPNLIQFAALIAAAKRDACAKVCDVVAESATKAAVAGQYLIIRNGAEARRCSAAIRAQAVDRLARHGINPCPDCHGVGYDASGQLCWCTGNPSF
jgi:hypothetical protein